MQVTAKIVAFIAVAILVTAGVVRAVPTVSNVSMTQIPNTRMVEIKYDLAVEDAIVTLSIETNGVAIPDSAVAWLSGDVCKVVETGNNKSITWNAGADWSENVTDIAKARVTAWCTNTPPQYCVVDLFAGPSQEAVYPVYYYTSAEGVPRGVTNDLYKTCRILMRRIDPTDHIGFFMGEGDGIKEVILTKCFYAGVFPVTQQQWAQVRDDWPSNFNDPASREIRPVELVSYNHIRGASLGAEWPNSAAVDGDSFMGLLRTKTGLSEFDLPTEAQWEYACRAGSTTFYNDGDPSANVNGTNVHINVWLSALGRYQFNGGFVYDGTNYSHPGRGCGPENGSAIVGSYTPNVWGLYDMHGNVWEFCLDRYASELVGGTDPVGPVTGSDCVIKGGCWNGHPSSCRSAGRGNAGTHSKTWSSAGFRLVRTIAQ